MQQHTRIYLEYFGYISKGENPIDKPFVPCEVCEEESVDIHHIKSRGMGGSKNKNVIENLMALCRTCHLDFGDITDFRNDLYKIHKLRITYNAQK